MMSSVHDLIRRRLLAVRQGSSLALDRIHGSAWGGARVDDEGAGRRRSPPAPILKALPRLEPAALPKGAAVPLGSLFPRPRPGGRPGRGLGPYAGTGSGRANLEIRRRGDLPAVGLTLGLEPFGRAKVGTDAMGVTGRHSLLSIGRSPIRLRILFGITSQ